MRSDLMKKGLEKAPHRSLFKAMGLTDEEIRRPMVGIANSANEIIPGHIHLDKIAEAVKAGVRLAGGTPIEFCTIGVCDGIAMNHEGMKYSLASRELIADSVEIMAIAHPFDALVLIPNCDKIVPGMLMAAMRVNIPSMVISGGPMLAGKFEEKEVDLIGVFEGVGFDLCGLRVYFHNAVIDVIRCIDKVSVFRPVRMPHHCAFKNSIRFLPDSDRLYDRVGRRVEERDLKRVFINDREGLVVG